jgi:hypothetical protein
LHYPNEAARHKLLDVVGDLSLIGTRIQGKVIANKPGHYVNTQFAKKLAKIIKIEQRIAPTIILSHPPHSPTLSEPYCPLPFPLSAHPTKLQHFPVL